jgi:hypothetical protein
LGRQVVSAEPQFKNHIKRQKKTHHFFDLLPTTGIYWLQYPGPAERSAKLGSGSTTGECGALLASWGWGPLAY